MQMNEVRISCYDSSVEVEITLRLSPFRAVLSTGAGGLGIPACLPESETAGFASSACGLWSVTRFCRLDQWQMFRLSSEDSGRGG